MSVDKARKYLMKRKWRASSKIRSISLRLHNNKIKGLSFGRTWSRLNAKPTSECRNMVLQMISGVNSSGRHLWLPNIWNAESNPASSDKTSNNTLRTRTSTKKSRSLMARFNLHQWWGRFQVYQEVQARQCLATLWGSILLRALLEWRIFIGIPLKKSNQLILTLINGFHQESCALWEAQPTALPLLRGPLLLLRKKWELGQFLLGSHHLGDLILLDSLTNSLLTRKSVKNLCYLTSISLESIYHLEWTRKPLLLWTWVKKEPPKLPLITTKWVTFWMWLIDSRTSKPREQMLNKTLKSLMKDLN